MTIAENDPRPSRTEEKWFGLLLLLVFGIVGSVLGWQLNSDRLTWTLVSIGISLAVLYYGLPALRTPFYRTWMALTMPLGRLISTGILAAIYFGAITPLALFQKLLRRDHLKRRFDASAQTYWEPYNPSEDTDRYFRQS